MAVILTRTLTIKLKIMKNNKIVSYMQVKGAPYSALL